MKVFSQKIKQKRGASMIMALIFLLFCVFIGGSILAASSANEARMISRKELEQRNLSQRSAAELLIAQLMPGDNGAQHEKTEVMFTIEGENITPVVSDTDVWLLRSAARHMLYDYVVSTYINNSSYSLTAEIQEADWPALCNMNRPTGVGSGSNAPLPISITDPNGKVITAELKCDPDDDYSIYICFTDGEEDISNVCVFMKGLMATSAGEVKIQWNDPILIKGGSF